MIPLNSSRKITGIIGLVVFIWCFGAIFDGAKDPIFGSGAIRLAAIGLFAVVPYLVIAFAQNSIVKKQHAKIEALIFANQLSDAENALHAIGTYVSNDAMQGTFIGLKLLSVVLERQGRFGDAMRVLKAIVKKSPDVNTRLVELESRVSDSSSSASQSAGG